MRRKVLKFPGGSLRIAGEEEVVRHYESITDPAALPLPDEVGILLTTADARRRISEHYRRVLASRLTTSHPHDK